MNRSRRESDDDDASPSSSDNDSVSNEDNYDSDDNAPAENKPGSKTKRRTQVNESSDDNDEGDFDNWNSRHDNNKTYSESDNSDDNRSDSDDDNDNNINYEALPLSERLKLRKEKKVNIKKRREKKAKALEFAREHVLNLTENKVNNQTRNSEDDYDSNNNDNDDNSDSSSVSEHATNETGKTKKKKKSKHAPTEASSKRSDFYKNQKKALNLNENGIGVTIGAGRFKPRDPRTSNLTGHFNEDAFEHKYSFIQEIRAKEIATLKNQIASIKTSGRKGQRHRKQLGVSVDDLPRLKEQLDTLVHEQAEMKRREIDRVAKQTVKQQLKANVASGKGGVYFPKRSELKRLELEAKFDEIRKRGGDAAVNKLVAKRRKKNKSRDANLLGPG